MDLLGVGDDDDEGNNEVLIWKGSAGFIYPEVKWSVTLALRELRLVSDATAIFTLIIQLFNLSGWSTFRCPPV